METKYYATRSGSGESETIAFLEISVGRNSHVTTKAVIEIRHWLDSVRYKALNASLRQ